MVSLGFNNNSYCLDNGGDEDGGGDDDDDDDEQKMFSQNISMWTCPLTVACTQKNQDGLMLRILSYKLMFLACFISV